MDASVHAIGMVLTQLDNNGDECVVVYGSQTLKDAECWYSPMHCECLAVFEWVKAY